MEGSVDVHGTFNANKEPLFLRVKGNSFELLSGAWIPFLFTFKMLGDLWHLGSPCRVDIPVALQMFKGQGESWRLGPVHHYASALGWSIMSTHAELGRGSVRWKRMPVH